MIITYFFDQLFRKRHIFIYHKKMKACFKPNFLQYQYISASQKIKNVQICLVCPSNFIIATVLYYFNCALF